MCPFGDIKYVPDSCDEEVRCVIAGSSCPICPHSKTVLNMSVACSSTELKSVTPNRLNSEVRATSSLAGARAGPELSNIWSTQSLKQPLRFPGCQFLTNQNIMSDK